jgi:hypothetical protein
MPKFLCIPIFFCIFAPIFCVRASIGEYTHVYIRGKRDQKQTIQEAKNKRHGRPKQRGTGGRNKEAREAETKA